MQKDSPDILIFTVSEFTRELRALLESSYGTVRIRGQITNLSRPQSGHVYFSLVDDEGDAGSRFTSAQIAVVIWRSVAGRHRFRLEDGMKVVVSGRVSVYEPRGTYQVIAERVLPVGVGELQLAYEQLKNRLDREGLFDPGRKRPLPFLPRRIGLVTSPSGAALRDFLRIVFQRQPRASIRLVPVRVQGEGAAEDVARAVDLLGVPESQVDVIVLTRGGGSLEDLWAFNDEQVARALFRSKIPTVSAVGHEVDVTIADFVADYRAPTPTAAAERVVPDLGELHLKLDGLRRRLVLALRAARERGEAALARAQLSRFFRDPQLIVQERLELIDHLGEAMRNHLYNRLERWDDTLARWEARLRALGPYSVLSRGYSVVTDARGNVVRSAAQLEVGEEVRILFQRGSAHALVQDREEKEDELDR